MEENEIEPVILLGFALFCIICGAADLYIGGGRDGASRIPTGWWGIGFGVLIIIGVFYEKQLSND